MNASSIHPLTAAAPAEPAANSELAFSFDRTSRRTVIRVVDRKTGELIEQIPAKDAFQMAL